ncbi:TNFRSF6B [Mytilus coruscus]|uniref:TNFRSF6B n=1 Tax=Mytilus coruscus TaxID=42192 RepID=A0A6J8CZG7_MYTCO|nr:TNFRSF6B [Mytilus coruscus]
MRKGQIVIIILCFGGYSVHTIKQIEIAPEIPTKTYTSGRKYGAVLHRYRKELSNNYGPHSTYIAPNGLTCYVCRPGFHKLSDCFVNRTIALCEPCPSGEYNSKHSRAIRCARCSTYCVDHHAVITHQCNATTDITCRCKNGYYNHSKGSREWICVPYSKCPPGEGVYVQGTSEKDTQCRRCNSSTYSSISSSEEKCKSCSVCSSGQIIDQICNGIQDNTCISKENIFILEIGYLKNLLSLLSSKSRNQSEIKKNGTKFNMVSVGLLTSTIDQSGKTNESTKEFTNAMETVSELPSDRCTDSERDHDFLERNKGKEWLAVFKTVSNNINVQKWKLVIRTLFSNYDDITRAQVKIDQICYRYPNDVVEQVYQCLLDWKKRAADEAYLDDIIDALKNESMLGMANDLQKSYSSLLNNTDNKR